MSKPSISSLKHEVSNSVVEEVLNSPPSRTTSVLNRESSKERQQEVNFEASRKNRRISFADETKEFPCASKDNAKLDENIYIRFHHSQETLQQKPSEQLASVPAEVKHANSIYFLPSKIHSYCTRISFLIYVLSHGLDFLLPLFLKGERDSSVYHNPADIYNMYKKRLNSSPPKSILKKSSSYPEKLQDCELKRPMQSSASFGSSLGFTFADSETDDGDLQPVRDISHLPTVSCVVLIYLLKCMELVESNRKKYWYCRFYVMCKKKQLLSPCYTVLQAPRNQLSDQ